MAGSYKKREIWRQKQRHIYNHVKIEVAIKLILLNLGYPEARKDKEGFLPDVFGSFGSDTTLISDL